MKKYLFILLAFVSCSKSDTSEITEEVVYEEHVIVEKTEPIFICNKNKDMCTSCAPELAATIAPDSSTYDCRIEIFDNTEYCQTKHISNKYLKDGKTVQNVGKFYHSVPFEMDEASNYLMELGQKQDYYESFDSMMCEVGGNSAYDKYYFKRDSDQRINSIKHYGAWYERYDEQGEAFYDYTPDWFLYGIVKIEYESHITRFKRYNEKKTVVEELNNFYDNHNRLVMQEWKYYDKVYNAYYYY